MDYLDDISVDDLQQALEEVEGKKAAQRLLAAIAYKNGVTQTELARWHDVRRKTIYNWLERLDTESLQQAVTDAHRPGRPRKLSSEQRKQFEGALCEQPTEVGYDAASWTPALVRHYLSETFDVEYSVQSCRRLMKEAGLRYRESRRTGTEVDSGEQAKFDAEREDYGKRWILR